MIISFFVHTVFRCSAILLLGLLPLSVVTVAAMQHPEKMDCSKKQKGKRGADEVEGLSERFNKQVYIDHQEKSLDDLAEFYKECGRRLNLALQPIIIKENANNSLLAQQSGRFFEKLCRQMTIIIDGVALIKIVDNVIGAMRSGRIDETENTFDDYIDHLKLIHAELPVRFQTPFYLVVRESMFELKRQILCREIKIIGGFLDTSDELFDALQSTRHHRVLFEKEQEIYNLEVAASYSKETWCPIS